MLELASLGSQVMHPRSVECASFYDIVIHLRSSTKDITGTYIKSVAQIAREASKMEKKEPVRGIALDENIAKVGILKVPDKPGIAAHIFGALAAESINVDMIVQSIHSAGAMADMAFTVNRTDMKKAVQVTEKLKKKLAAVSVIWDPDVCKVSIVGKGMVSQPGTAAKMFDALSKAKINIQMISTSEIRVSCVVRKEQGKKAVQILHKVFGLEKVR